MNRSFCVFAVLFLAVAASQAASTPQRAQPALLPDHVGKWSASASSETKPEASAEELSETGFVNSAERTYSAEGNTFTAAIYQFHDPSSAYQIYSSQLSSSSLPSTVGNNTAINHDTLIALVGNYVVKVWPVQMPAGNELSELLRRVRARADQTPLPPIRAYLPEGFIDGTQKYALGPAGLKNALRSLKREEFEPLIREAGFASGAESIAAEYRNGADSAALLLIDYPTPQLAEQHLRHMEQALTPEARQAGTTIERKASLLSLVLRPSSAAYGGALRSAVNYETHVTWNEPTHTITDPPWTTILGKIFVTTFLFMIVAVALGAAFGGVRVLTKVFFPGKVFDRPERMDILQLGISSKRIDSGDFY